MKKRALVSVSDKSGVVELCKELVNLGYEIISTGGTHKVLAESGIKVIGISDITGFPECLDGRVKTLHPAVHAGLLAMRSNPEHMSQLEKLNINTIDIVVVNLYPFKQTIMKEGVEFAEAVENIDIGGPTMLRSAAKNYQDVLVLVDPKDYSLVVDGLKSGEVDIKTRKYLMYKVYQHTAVYDTLISTYLRKDLGIEYPESVTYAYEKSQEMRYGENPHQSAAFYHEVMPVKGALSNAEQLNGKELSFNNINDTNGALDLLREFDEPTAVAVKHTNPCGVASAKNISEAMQLAYDADPVSIFGGIIALNRTVDLKTAEIISKIFIEIVVAPDFDKDALELLKQKSALRLLRLPDITTHVDGLYEMKKVRGGLLVQGANDKLIDDYTVVTSKAPEQSQIKDMIFAMKVVKHTKSNAIVLVKDGVSVGIGAGQTNRIWATNQAIEHAGDKAKGAIMASDAFFPFNDCVIAAAEGGIAAIVQPGGSKRDQESIDKANELGIPMIFTGLRHFKH